MAGRKKAGDAPAFLWRKPVLRGKWTQLFADYRARIHITYLEVPWLQLLQQNKQRAHAVPEDVKLELPGYDEAHEVAYGIMPP